MKTIDEVIDWYANRRTVLIGRATKEEMEDSVLHYLKAFRDAKDALDAEREKTIEAYCQWKDAREKLEAQTSQMMWVDKHFQFEISDNPPLDWETLKQMEGKPVWVEERSCRLWIIARNFQRVQYGNIDTEWLRTDIREIYYDKADLGKSWQAYRKERHDSQ